MHRLGRHFPRCEEAGEYVVAVGPDVKRGHRKPHACGGITGEDVAEIAGRHGEGDGTVGGAQSQSGAKVVDDLRSDPRPIDRIDCRQPVASAKVGIVEHRLHQILAIVEGTIDGDIVDIRHANRGHLPTLRFRYPSMRVEHENFCRCATAHRLDGGRSRIARGRTDDDDSFAAAGEHGIEHAPHDLQGHVLEGKGRTMEQLHQPDIVVQLFERSDGCVAKAGISGVHQSSQFAGCESRPDEGLHDPGRQLGIRQTAPGTDVIR